MDTVINITVEDKIGTSFIFTELETLYDYLNHEKEFWESAFTRIENGQHALFREHPNIKSYADTTGALITKINEILQQEEITQAEENSIAAEKNTLASNISRHKSWLWSGHPFIESFINCNIEHGNGGATTFFNVIEGKGTININSVPNFKSAFLAYENIRFQEGHEELAESERQSIINLRTRLVNSHTDILNKSQQIFREVANWQRIVKKEWNEWYLDNSVGFQDERVASKEAVNTLIDVFKEQKRLEEPAEYWSKSADDLKVQSRFLLVGLSVFIIIGVLLFFYLFKLWLDSKTIPFSLSSVQGVILFATGVSVYAFMIRVLSRMLFSTLHLKRDAEERLQLTHVFLSLIHENAITSDERMLILQALFSRSDTGLLSGENTITMPNISTVVKPRSNTTN